MRRSILRVSTFPGAFAEKFAINQESCALNQLVGVRLSGLGAIESLIMFQFGELRHVGWGSGKVKKVGELALHVSCAWRVLCEEGIIAGQGDWGFRETEYRKTKLSPKFSSLVVQRLESLDTLASSSALVVERITLGKAGDLRLSLTDGYALEVAPLTSYDEIEYWRLLRPETDEPHLVCGSYGFEWH